MEKEILLENLYQAYRNVYDIPLIPEIVDRAYLKELGVKAEPSDETVDALIRGSELFIQRLEEKTLLPHNRLVLEEIDPDTVETEIHNYTGHCPTLTFEVNPVRGCHVGCQYCLVTDGVHEQTLTAYENYHLYVRKLLEEMNGTPQEEITQADIQKKNDLLRQLAEAIESHPEKKKEIENQIVELSRGKNWNHYYYFSPKTEALQEATLQTGIAHRILKEFIAHFKKYPNSNARLFVASKAGTKHLQYAYEGETILSLFAQLKDKMQFNTSVSMMPPIYQEFVEPYAAAFIERVRAVKLCREQGVLANSALVQPIIIPHLDNDLYMIEFFRLLREAGVVNYKPEFLTVCMENLAMLGQLLGCYDKKMERQLYEAYILPANADHKKQRGRTAPDRELSLESIRRLKGYTDSCGMSVSICYWVRKQLQISGEMIPIINENGFQCLGYQSRLFAKERTDQEA